MNWLQIAATVLFCWTLASIFAAVLFRILTKNNE